MSLSSPACVIFVRSLLFFPFYSSCDASFLLPFPGLSLIFCGFSLSLSFQCPKHVYSFRRHSIVKWGLVQSGPIWPYFGVRRKLHTLLFLLFSFPFYFNFSKSPVSVCVYHLKDCHFIRKRYALPCQSTRCKVEICNFTHIFAFKCQQRWQRT